MAVGPNYSADQLRWRAAQLASRRRALELDVQEFHSYVTRIDVNGLMEAGFSPGDAADFKYLADVHHTVAAVYFGVAAQPSEFNFDDALSAIRGPGLNG
jgi:hypothetical protein